MAMNSLSVLGGNFATTAYVNSVASLRLITPTSIANSGGSASVSGGEVTFTGVSSISFNGVFSATYDNYRIITKATASTRVALNMRMRVAGVDNTTANYQAQLSGAEAAAGVFVRASNQTSGRIAAVDTTTTPISTDIMSPFLAEVTVMTSLVGLAAATTGNSVAMESMGHNVASSFDGFTLLPASGTLTGKIRIYGYQNS